MHRRGPTPEGLEGGPNLGRNNKVVLLSFLLLRLRGLQLLSAADKTTPAASADPAYVVGKARSWCCFVNSGGRETSVSQVRMFGRLAFGLTVFVFRLASALAVLFVFTMLQEPPKSAASDNSRFIAASLGNDTGAFGDELSRPSTDRANSSRETQGHAEEIETAQSITTPEPRSSEAPAAAVPPARRGLTPAEVTAYTALARAKIQQGDIAAARRLLERASDSDDADALLALAETYDPGMLAQWGVIGVKPNVELAKTLYNRAGVRGAKRAKERLLAIQK